MFSNENNYFIQSLICFKLAGHNDFIANALYELGRIHLRFGYVKEALQEFSKLLAMAKRIPDPKGICNAHMELAFAYKVKKKKKRMKKKKRKIIINNDVFTITY